MGHLGVSVRRQLRRIFPGRQTSLNDIIPGEIKDDAFYRAIRRHAAAPEVRTVLEIGSSSGEGSTRAFVSGILDGGSHARLYCMEVSQARFDALKKAYAAHDFVRPYNCSSVPLRSFPAPGDVTRFYRSRPTALNKYPLEMVLGWLKADILYVTEHGRDEEGIRSILETERLKGFDLVLIDGSEFTGRAELERVLGARVIMLDDINSFKNYDNYFALKSNPRYSLEEEDWSLRGGYAIFVSRGRWGASQAVA
jgi:hypothetical protein